MAGHKPSEKKKMMGGGRLYAKDGLYARKKKMKKVVQYTSMVVTVVKLCQSC